MNCFKSTNWLSLPSKYNPINNKLKYFEHWTKEFIFQKVNIQNWLFFILLLLLLLIRIWLNLAVWFFGKAKCCWLYKTVQYCLLDLQLLDQRERVWLYQRLPRLYRILISVLRHKISIPVTRKATTNMHHFLWFLHPLHQHWPFRCFQLLQQLLDTLNIIIFYSMICWYWQCMTTTNWKWNFLGLLSTPWPLSKVQQIWIFFSFHNLLLMCFVETIPLISWRKRSDISIGKQSWWDHIRKEKTHLKI